MGMSRFLSSFLAGFLKLVLSLLGERRGLKVLARLYAALDPKGKARVRSKTFTLAVPDGTAHYWVTSGPNSEPGTLDWVDGFGPEDVLYDIGANVGLYTLYAASKGAHVVAFEPNPFTYAVLVRNLHLNDLASSVMPLLIALDATSHHAALSLSGIQAGSVHNGLGRGDGLVLDVLAQSLDDMVERFRLRPPSHIKLDVDGIEEQILQGAEATLANPGLKSVLVEDCPQDPARQTRIAALIEAAGLRLSQAESRDGNRLFRRT